MSILGDKMYTRIFKMITLPIGPPPIDLWKGCKPKGKKGDKGDKGDKGECVISPIPPANPPTYNLNLYAEFFEEWGFEENFKQNWFINNQFSHLFTENFTWVEQSGEYAQVLQETFQQDWFIFNQYGMNILIESFENSWFTINNYNSNIFVENWEEGGW